MKKLLWILGIVLMGAVLAIGPSSIAVADEEKELPCSEFLFMLENAYLAEKGKGEVCFISQYMDNKKSREVEYEDSEREDTLKLKDKWEWILGFEYGIFDWLTLGLEIPFANVDKKTIKDKDTTTVKYLDKTGIEDIAAGLKIRLLEEDKKSWIPALALGFETSFPTGNYKKDLGSNHYGFASGMLISKTFNKFAYHINVGGGYTPHAREEGETKKKHEAGFEGGIALVYMPNKNLILTSEIFAELETEKGGGERNYGSEIYAIPGIAYEFEKFLGGINVGIGIPIGLTYESYDWGIITKVTKEF